MAATLTPHRKKKKNLKLIIYTTIQETRKRAKSTQSKRKEKNLKAEISGFANNTMNNTIHINEMSQFLEKHKPNLPNMKQVI